MNLKQITLPVGPQIELPFFLSKASCGLFGISEDFIDKYQSLDQLLIKNKYSTFFFEADGDSMEPTIRPGQILIVDRSISSFNGRVCIICYEDKLICKRVQIRPDSIILKSDNPKYRDIIVHNQESTLFWGVVVGVAGFIK